MCCSRYGFTSVLLVTMQLLAIALLALLPFEFFSVSSFQGPGAWTIRIVFSILLLFNTVVMRFMLVNVMAWVGMAAHLVAIGLMALLFSWTKHPRGDHHHFLYVPHDNFMLIALMSLSGCTFLLQVLFRLVLRNENPFSLCSGGLGLSFESVEYELIDDEETPLTQDDSHIQGLELMSDQKIPLQSKQGCNRGIMAAWTMRICSIVMTASCLWFLLVATGIAITNSESKDPLYIKGHSAIVIIDFWYSAAILVWSVFLHFGSWRWSSRRRLLLFIVISFLFLAYTITSYIYNEHINHALGRSGSIANASYFLPAVFQIVWTIAAITSLFSRTAFDYSCCSCFRLRFSGMGQCAVA
jgi:hypothetical protein